MKKINITRRGLIEFIKSNVAGNALFITTYVSNLIFAEVFDVPSEQSLLYALIVGNTLGNLFNFLLQKFWVFDGKRNSAQVQMGRYVIFMIVNAGIFYAIVLGQEKFLGISPHIGQFTAGWFFIVWNYFWYKEWVFKKGGTRGSKKTKQKAA